jgi:peptidoglycan/xylan/chitin deacetylase (PgdA/CDA1 family)
MPAIRNRIGSDTPYHEWSPIVARKPLHWPNGARVALAVIVNIEYMELEAPSDTVVPPTFIRHGPYPALPDIHEVSPHEYGNRVGIFRVMKVLDRHGIRATAALDAAAARRYPFLVNEAKRRDWEFIGHSLVSNRMITENMPEAKERENLREALSVVREATGARVRGWIGADHGQSSRTVRLLAAEGVDYMCDWPNDEQPYRMNVPQGRMVALPTTLELDDCVNRARRIAIDRWSRLICEAFDRLHHDGAENGRTLVLNLHPWVTGQPYRIRALDEALAHIVARGAVWCATGSEIVDSFLQQQAN